MRSGAAPAPPERDVRRYHRRQLVLAVAGHLVSALVLAAWAWSGAAAWFAAFHVQRLRTPAGVVAGLALSIGASVTLATLPLDVWSGFVLPRRAGLLHLPPGAWLRERAKALALGGTLLLLAIELLYALMRWSPDAWWLWMTAAVAAASAALGALVPCWLAPLFFRLTPLDDPVLAGRVLALAGRLGVEAREVLVADASRRGRTANAAVAGLGRTRRILVSDTLVAGFPVEEVEVVLAHELAHVARGHLWHALALQGLLALAALWLLHRALGTWGPALGLDGPADPAGLPLVLLAGGALGLAATPAAAAWSRRMEREADRAALEATGAPGAFAAAMERLAALNLAERRPGRLRQRLLATHPSIEERVATAAAFARRHHPHITGGRHG